MPKHRKSTIVAYAVADSTAHQPTTEALTPDQIEVLLRKLGNKQPRVRRATGKVEYIHAPCMNGCYRSYGRMNAKVSLATGKFHCDDCRLSSLSLTSYLRLLIIDKAKHLGVTGENWSQLARDFIDSTLHVDASKLVWFLEPRPEGVD
jgi:hypothetical protein